LVSLQHNDSAQRLAQLLLEQIRLARKHGREQLQVLAGSLTPKASQKSYFHSQKPTKKKPPQAYVNLVLQPKHFPRRALLVVLLLHKALAQKLSRPRHI
jgi:hypothetical protein